MMPVAKCHYYTCEKTTPDIYYRVSVVKKSGNPHHQRIKSFRFCSRDCLAKFFATDKLIEFIDNLT